jgi:hypothetical protein
VSSFFARTGIEEGGLGAAKTKKCPVDTFLARGRFYWSVTAAGTAVDTDQSTGHQKRHTPKGVWLFWSVRESKSR